MARSLLRSTVLSQVSLVLSENGNTTILTMLLATVKKMVGPLAPTRYQSGYGFTSLQVVLVALLAFLVGLAVAFYGHSVAEMFVESKPEIVIRNLTQNSPLGGLSQLWATR